MYKEIKIGGQSMALLSNAATPVYYRQIFHKDLVKALSEISQDRFLAMSITPEIAYVMNQQAQKANIATCNDDTFLEWLEQFDDALTFVDAEDDVWGSFYGTMQTESEPKKKAEKQKEK